MGTATKVEGDTFILCTFPLMFGGTPLVLDSGHSPEMVCKTIPEWLAQEEDTICFCRVDHWTFTDGEMTPHGVETIFQITPFNLDALDDEED